MMVIRVPDLIAPPVTNPDLDEIRFFLRIMGEHSLFIQLGLPCLEPQLISQAVQFQDIFRQLAMQAQKLTPAEIPAFAPTVAAAVENLRRFKRHLLQLVITCNLKLGNWNAPLLLDHISREAEYFLKVLQKIQTGSDELTIDSIVQENVFWTRIMSDHAKFIRSLLDPSERRFVEIAHQFSEEFQRLLAQARDIEGYLWDYQPIPTLPRFEGEIIDATKRIRDFKAEAAKLLEDCAALSVAPPLLLDHVRREAEHFLKILDTIQSRLRQPGCGA
ncbi:MAG: DUF2935 domain-containing protein [Chloroflexota bacterium]